MFKGFSGNHRTISKKVGRDTWHERRIANTLHGTDVQKKQIFEGGGLRSGSGQGKAGAQKRKLGPLIKGP